MARPARKKSAPAARDDKSLLLALADAPRLTDRKAAQARLTEWLTEIGRNASGKALKLLVAKTPKLEALLLGLVDGSPYLWDLAIADPDRLVSLLQADPDRHLADLLGKSGNAAAAAKSEAAAMRGLRHMKAEAALLIALADIGGVWPVMRTTKALTEVADTAVAAAVRFLLRDAVRRGRLNPADRTEPEQGSGHIVLAMGKMGASELNYSSDIDLIVFYDADAPALVDKDDVTAFHVQIARGLVKLLQTRTGDGYVFRVDLRLRPDPASTAIAVSTETALNYYSSVGQNWERAAFIKARPCAGDIAAGEAILAQLQPFIWRKYLDYVALADIEALKRQIHAYRGHDAIAVEGHNIKLGRGGIREIEFFVQTQQLIAGGRAPELRGKQTLPMLDALVAARWIDATVRDDLAAAYIYLRRVEHRLQMMADEQTHTLPGDAAVFEKFARFLGYSNRDDFAAELVGHLTRVQEHYSRLFEDAPPLATRLGTFEFEAKENRETLDTLVKIGFEPLPAYAVIREWFSGEYFALKSEAARTDLKTILPTLLDSLARSGSADTALLACDRFFSELVEGARLFAALRTHPDLVELLALILGTAPRLGDIVAHQPSLLDALLDPAFFGSIPSEAILTARLNSLLADAETEEEVFDRSRRFGREQMVLIGVRILSGVLSASQAGEAYATLADVLIRALHRATETRFAETYGRMKDSETAILALGKLGGREMTAGSDLDLLLLYDFDSAQPESNGERKLGGGQYYARFTKRLISALTTPTNEGKLYDVDMRLRPSGRSGPVATSIESFAEYQRKQAWTWEHMALTRARVVSAEPGFHGQIEGLIAEVLCAPRDRRKIAGDILEMRALIANEKGESDRWDLKHAAGGLVDLEFIAQFLSLVHAHSMPEILDTNTLRILEKAQSLGILNAADG
jgi:glutamate-ammonia-ligase adenylyltransferase